MIIRKKSDVKSLTRQFLIIGLCLIILGSFQPALPFSKAISVQSHTVSLQQGQFYAIPLTFEVSAIIAYATNSTAQVSTAFMNAEQYSSFQNSGNVSDSIYDQNGTRNFNELLAPPGTYYFVAAAYSSAADVTFLYDNFTEFSVQNATTYVGQFINIQPGTNDSITLNYETAGANFNMTLFGASNQTVTYSLYDYSTQKTIFISQEVTITNISSSSLSYNFTSLSQGVYSLTIANYGQSQAYVYYEYHLFPKYNDPYLAVLYHGGFNSPQPTGIASYGITNNSGSVTSYKIETSKVVGSANISSISAYNATASSVGVEPDMSSLQLNSILVVNNGISSQFVYWPQNIIYFLTNSSILTTNDNILNMTGDNALVTNQSITSSAGGIVKSCSNCATPQYYYGIYAAAPIYNYTLPLSFRMMMSETVESGEGVLIQMGIQQRGEAPSWFDNITIHDDGVQSAYFFVAGNESTPVGAASAFGAFYDAELVFGGGGNGEATYFKSLNASLGLYYLDPQNRTQAFPSYYSFGADTAETADNIYVTYSGNGTVQLSTGSSNYGYLGGAQGTSLPTTTTLPQFSSSSSPVTTQASSVSSQSQVSHTFCGSQEAPGCPGPDIGGAIFLLAIIIIIIAGTALALRRRNGKRKSFSYGGDTNAGPDKSGSSGSQPPQTFPRDSSRAALSSQTPFCSNCGARSELGEKFCGNCGSKLQSN